MHRAGDAVASSHHSAEDSGGTSPDAHFALVNQGDQVGWQALGALGERGHARRE